MGGDEISQNGSQRPAVHNWDKRVSAAYLRLQGATQAYSAKAVGVTRRTIANWEAHESWLAAREEARSRWLDGLADNARARLSDALAEDGDGDGRLALAILERLEPELAPAAKKLRLRLSVVEHIAGLPTEVLREVEDMTDDEVMALLPPRLRG